MATQHDYYRLALDRGLHLLYRKGPRGGAWAAMLNPGNGAKRSLAKIGVADDQADADGVAFLSFSQAQAAARKLFEQAARRAAGVPELAWLPRLLADLYAAEVWS